MRMITWNVNGLRACLGKGFLDFVSDQDADMICLQETKMQKDQADFENPYPHEYWNSAVKKGYSGTAIFSKFEPVCVTYGIGVEQHDQEGRVITAEYEPFYLVCCYTPNSQRELARLDYRMAWEDAFKAYLCALDEKKPVILCGDLNVAFSAIDLKNPKTNERNAGYTIEERTKLGELLAAGFVDAFRALYPDVTGAYTWWSYMFRAREKNAGWRIDYFIISERLVEKVRDVKILSDVMGSDHCPVALELDL